MDKYCSTWLCPGEATDSAKTELL